MPVCVSVLLAGIDWLWLGSVRSTRYAGNASEQQKSSHEVTSRHAMDWSRCRSPIESRRYHDAQRWEKLTCGSARREARPRLPGAIQSFKQLSIQGSGAVQCSEDCRCGPRCCSSCLSSLLSRVALLELESLPTDIFSDLPMRPLRCRA